MLRDARAAASHTDTYTRAARGAPPRGALPGVQGRGRGAMCRLHRGGILHAALRGVGAGLRTLSRGHGGRGAPKASQAPRGASPSRAAPRRSAAAARRPAAAPRSRRRPRAPRRRPRTHPPFRARRVRTGGAQGGELRARAGVGTRPRRAGLLHCTPAAAPQPAPPRARTSTLALPHATSKLPQAPPCARAGRTGGGRGGGGAAGEEADAMAQAAESVKRR